MPASRSNSRPGPSPKELQHIPRPMNPFFLFRSHYCKTQGAREIAEGRTNQNQISKQVAIVWKSMTPEEQAPYHELYQKGLIEHAAKYPTYAYPAPNKKRATPPKKKTAAPRKPAVCRKKRASSLDSDSDSDCASSAASSSSSISEQGPGKSADTGRSHTIVKDNEEKHLLSSTSCKDSPPAMDLDGLLGANRISYFPNGETYSTGGNTGVYEASSSYQFASGFWCPDMPYLPNASFFTDEDMSALTLSSQYPIQNTSAAQNTTMSSAPPFSPASDAFGFKQVTEWVDLDSWPN
ncbi:hypothetical protein BKA70DRAFT_7409 [Coprinopsis sp. MPI-PUGE-AT-0042]|nr:hypothetical protein BKA70DRAFT_7409 [Coprinopsis sp. MPI-PUGE-AT-0042]